MKMVRIKIARNNQRIKIPNKTATTRCMYYSRTTTILINLTNRKMGAPTFDFPLETKKEKHVKSSKLG